VARVINRLALPAEVIRTLPDNYVATVRSGQFPVKFDATRPQQAFLPPDLLAESGDWFFLKRADDKPVAPQHVRFVCGRSVFFVICNFPAGRSAVQDFLRASTERVSPITVPVFPVGTQVALVREMLAIDDKGVVVPTGLIEEIQLRVFPDESSSRSF
jgi:hypothetical protein